MRSTGNRSGAMPETIGSGILSEFVSNTPSSVTIIQKLSGRGAEVTGIGIARLFSLGVERSTIRLGTSVMPLRGNDTPSFGI